MAEASPKDSTTAAAGPRRRRARRLLVAAFKVGAVLVPTALGVAVGAEVLARRYVAGTWGFIAPDPLLGWSYVPGSEGDAIVDRDEGLRKNRVRINSLGFRDREFAVEKAPGTIRIAVIGDSFVEAIQVAEDAMFTRLLEGHLNAEAPEGVRYEVVAAGNGNYGTDQELLFWRERVRPLAPDVVVCVMFPFNDFADNVPELNDRLYMPKRFFSLEGDRLVGPGETQSTPGTLALQGPHNPVLSRIERTMAYAVGRQWVRAYHPRMAEGLENAGLLGPDSVETPDGLPIMWDVARTPLSPPWEDAVDLASILMGQMRSEVEESGADFYLVLMPFTEHIFATNPEWVRERWPQLLRNDFDASQPENLARALAAEAEIEMLDLSPAFVEAVRATGEGVNILPNGHLNEHGNAVTAEAMAAFLAPRLAGLQPDAEAAH